MNMLKRERVKHTESDNYFFVWSFNTNNKELSFDLSPFGSTRIMVCNGSKPSGITELAAQQYMAQFSNSQRFEMASFNGSSYKNFSEYIVNRANDLTLTIYKKEVRNDPSFLVTFDLFGFV